MDESLSDFLLVVDVQNDFITGALGSADAQAVLPNIVARVEQYIERQKVLLLTMDTHDKDHYSETPEGKHIPFHCGRGSEGWDYPKELKDKLMGYTDWNYLNHIFEKETFGAPNLIKFMHVNYYYQPKSVEILGLDTDCCVLANAITLRTMCPWLKLSVNRNCCAGTSKAAHDAALKMMEGYQIDIV